VFAIINDVNWTSILPVDVVLAITTSIAANAAFRLSIRCPCVSLDLDLDEGKIKIDMPLSSCPTTVVHAADFSYNKSSVCSTRTHFLALLADDEEVER
jgi:hypothetical protein